MSDSGQEEKPVTAVAVQLPTEDATAGNGVTLRRLLRKTDLLVMPGLCMMPISFQICDTWQQKLTFLLSRYKWLC